VVGKNGGKGPLTRGKENHEEEKEKANQNKIRGTMRGWVYELETRRNGKREEGSSS